MVLHMSQPDIDVWALCVDHTGTVPLSLPVKVQLSHRSSVYDLKKAIKEEMKPILDDLAAPRLIVWKLEDSFSTQEAGRADFLQMISYRISDSQHCTGNKRHCDKVAEGQRIQQLVEGVSEDHVVFLIQCPPRKHCS
jgi:hypothetical protein